MLCACAQLSPTEKMLVGTWQFTGIDATGRMVLRADHRSATLFPITGQNFEVVAKGSWRVDGDELVRIEKPTFGPSVPGDAPPKVQTTRMRIREIHRDRLVVGDGPDMKRVE